MRQAQHSRGGGHTGTLRRGKANVQFVVDDVAVIRGAVFMLKLRLQLNWSMHHHCRIKVEQRSAFH
jgi:hypothetical protein